MTHINVSAFHCTRIWPKSNCKHNEPPCLQERAA